MRKRVIIVGAGLSGLLAAYILSRNDNMEIIIIEKGKQYRNRDGKVGADLVCGEGGAGTIYGGKLCFPPASSGVWLRSKMQKYQFENFKQKFIDKFLTDLYPVNSIDWGGYLYKKGEFLTKNYPCVYISKREMKGFVERLITANKKSGVMIFHNCNFLEYKNDNGKYLIKSVIDDKYIYNEKADYLIFASGRESSNLIRKWLSHKNNVILQNPDLGIRFSIQNNKWGIFQQVGKDIKIKMQFDHVAVRTFCVCAGGTHALVNLNDIQYFDGHFDDFITKEVNLGILARSPYIFGYEGAALYCQSLRKYINADLSLKDFCIYSDHFLGANAMFDDIFNGIKEFVYVLQREGILEDNLDKYPAWLPSADRWNSIVETNQYFETKEKNLYIIGDAIGISRGFIQAMWSAYCASNNILLKTHTNVEEMV